MGKLKNYLSWFVTRPHITRKRNLSWLDMHQQAGDPDSPPMHYTKEGLSPLEKAILVVVTASIIGGLVIIARHNTTKIYSEKLQTQYQQGFLIYK